MDVVLRQAELLEVAPHGLRGDALLAQRRHGRALGPLRELLAVLAEDQPVVDELRRARPERLEQPAVERLVRPVVVPADHVRDPEVDVVHDARQVVGRRAVLADEGRAVETLAAAGHRPRGDGRRRSLCRTGPSSHSSPSHSRSRRSSSSPPATLRAGSVSSMRSSSQSPNARLATALSAFPTWSDPVGLGAKRTRFMAPL